MSTYYATIRTLFGGASRVPVLATSYNQALTIAQSQYGDRLVYVELD